MAAAVVSASGTEPLECACGAAAVGAAAGAIMTPCWKKVCKFCHHGAPRTTHRMFLRHTTKDPDFDAEAHKLFKSLNLDPGGAGGFGYNPLDPIFRDPVSGGTVFVGNHSAASNRTLLDSNKITHVVNCTDNMANFHENGTRGEMLGHGNGPGRLPLTYFRFNISYWHRHVDDSDDSVISFVRPLFDFVDSAVASGASVLVHCLAGAHRAGTTGCLLLMYKADMDKRTAIASAKKLRPAIDPIGSLPEFLERYERAHRKHSTR